MIVLTQMDDELRTLGGMLVNPAEVATVKPYHYHSFRPASGSVVTMNSGESFRVHESPAQVLNMIETNTKE